MTKREEQIEEYIKIHANSFSVRNGYTGTEELMRGMAKWCDNNPKNDWISVDEELPEKTSEDSYVSKMVVVKCAWNPNRWYPAEYWYDTKQWFCCEVGTSSDYLDDVTHWKYVEM